MARSSRIGGSVETLRRLDEVDPFITLFIQLNGRTAKNWGKNCEHALLRVKDESPCIQLKTSI